MAKKKPNGIIMLLEMLSSPQGLEMLAKLFKVVFRSVKVR